MGPPARAATANSSRARSISRRFAVATYGASDTEGANRSRRLARSSYTPEVRLGYACLTLGMPNPSMRTAQLTRYRLGLVDLPPISAYTLDSAHRSAEYAAEHGFLASRLSSDIFPLLDSAEGPRALVPPLAPLSRTLA